MVARISEDSFNAWLVLADHEQQLQSGKYGACASFIGTMRDFSTQDVIDKMTLTHYPAMTEQYLHKLENEAREQWPLQDCLIVHRVGDIYPADDIVAIACWSAHRRAALDACNWLIEELKHRAPFWKKEYTSQGEHWVEKNTDGF